MSRVVKEILLMHLHSINRGTNYIVYIFLRLIQAFIMLDYVRNTKDDWRTVIAILIESEILVNNFAILFFFTFSPIREYIQSNWKEVNLKIKNIWKV